MANNVKYIKRKLTVLFFCDIISMVILMSQTNNEISYKLYKTVREILHPTISKKNISNYNIVIDEKLLAVKVFYPKRVTNMKKIVLFVQGNVTPSDKYYDNISQLSKKTEQLIILLNIDKKTSFKIKYMTLKYIYKELIKEQIDEQNITFMGDDIGASNILNILCNKNYKGLNIYRSILFYPVMKSKNDTLKSKNFFKITEGFKLQNRSILIIYGNNDEYYEIEKKISKENVKITRISFATNNFLDGSDKETLEDCYKIINNYLKDKNYV